MRVPVLYKSIEPKIEIHRSLRTDSKKEALARQPAAEAAIIAELDAKLAIDAGSSSGDAFGAAVALAASRGLTYRPAENLAAGPLADILERLETLRGNGNLSDAKAVLGGVDVPTLPLSQFAAEIERLAAYDNRFKSEVQLRIWRNAIIRAASNLLAALGADRPVLEIDKAAAYAHRKWWQQRIETGVLSPETARKRS